MAASWEVATICGALSLDGIVGGPEEPSELFSVWKVLETGC